MLTLAKTASGGRMTRRSYPQRWGSASERRRTSCGPTDVTFPPHARTQQARTGTVPESGSRRRRCTAAPRAPWRTTVAYRRRPAPCRARWRCAGGAPRAADARCRTGHWSSAGPRARSAWKTARLVKRISPTIRFVPEEHGPSTYSGRSAAPRARTAAHPPWTPFTATVRMDCGRFSRVLLLGSGGFSVHVSQSRLSAQRHGSGRRARPHGRTDGG
jgi:hypothetical protein